MNLKPRLHVPQNAQKLWKTGMTPTQNGATPLNLARTVQYPFIWKQSAPYWGAANRSGLLSLGRAQSSWRDEKAGTSVWYTSVGCGTPWDTEEGINCSPGMADGSAGDGVGLSGQIFTTTWKIPLFPSGIWHATCVLITSLFLHHTHTERLLQHQNHCQGLGIKKENELFPCFQDIHYTVQDTKQVNWKWLGCIYEIVNIWPLLTF